MSTKARTMGYWVATGLAAFAIGMGGVMDLRRPPDLVEGMAHLGYPAYFMLVLGAWKVLGALAIVAPRFPRLKEWAYAGIAFDLTGAAFSHGASGDPAGKVMTPLVILAIAAASWALRPESRRLTSPAAAPAQRHASAGDPAAAPV